MSLTVEADFVKLETGNLKLGREYPKFVPPVCPAAACL